jgi:dynein heavy chain
MVMTLCKALKPLLEANVKNLEYVFVYALVWSLGGGLSEKDGMDFRKEFSNWWKAEWKTSVRFPPKGTIFDYYVDASGDSVKFEEWTKKVQTIDFDTQQGHQMNSFTIPTRETVSTSEFINTLLMV